MDEFSTPILLIGFNRPDKTQKVFYQIREVKPKYFYFAVDGFRPEKEGERELCQETAGILKQIDWDCEVHTLFGEKNLGCGKGPVVAITWFFEHVEEGIILEDDSIPHIDFFIFCRELLVRFRNNTKVMAIGSVNFQNGKNRSNGSYYFSMQNGCLCSWATWKRSWSLFSYTLDNISSNAIHQALKAYRVTKNELKYWMDNFEIVKANQMDDTCWDIQFLCTIWINHGMGIVPNVNLSTNIGFDAEATHTFDPIHPGSNLPSYPILPIKHPTEIKINRKADLHYHKCYYQPNEYGWLYLKRLPNIVKNKMKRFIKHLLLNVQFTTNFNYYTKP